MEIYCPHFESCSGCSLKTKLEMPERLKEVQQCYPVALQAGAAEGWRCRARLAVRGGADAPQIGLFKEGTHQVVDIPFCKIHHPRINQAVECVRSWIMDVAFPLYNEVQGTGLLRYLQLSVDRASKQLQLALVLNCKDSLSIDSSLFSGLQAALCQAMPSTEISLWLNFNMRRDNVIFGGSWQLLCGSPWLCASLLGKPICYHPGSFMQANPSMFEALLSKLALFIPPNSSVIEFFAGVGAIGLSLLDRCRKVMCVELVPLAKACFEASFSLLSADEKQKICFQTGEASPRDLEGEWDVVIVDPPRKGLTPKFIEALCAAEGVKRLIYISCEWESFKRDCAALQKPQVWELSALEPFLFFPGSQHLELLAVFDRKDSR
jgi:23S rRNA (uracil1939-C5)-methyltransferase